jgi:hypothetical protein
MSNGILDADFREVIRGRVCVDGVLYSHPHLAAYEGQTVTVWRAEDGIVAEPIGADNTLDFIPLAEQRGSEDAGGMWHFNSIPQRGNRFVAIYRDGGGVTDSYLHESGRVIYLGGEDWTEAMTDDELQRYFRKQYECWAYLPGGLNKPFVMTHECLMLFLEDEVKRKGQTTV